VPIKKGGCEYARVEGNILLDGKPILHKTYETGDPIDVMDNMVCIVRMRRGILGTGSFSWTYYAEEENGTVLYGEAGKMRIYESRDCQIEVIKPHHEITRYQIESIQSNDHQTSSGVIDAFIESVQNHSEPPVTGEDGYEALKAILAAAHSAQNGDVINL
jgi:predicted dehydrogenase